MVVIHRYTLTCIFGYLSYLEIGYSVVTCILISKVYKRCNIYATTEISCEIESITLYLSVKS